MSFVTLRHARSLSLGRVRPVNSVLRDVTIFLPTRTTLPRHARSASVLASFPSRSRVSTLFKGLVVLGVASTSFGLYQFYTTFTMWPKEVRSDLRAGMKAKHQGDLDMSEKYLKRALETALSLSLDLFAPEPHLKLSGIAISLAGVLEDDSKPQEAYEVYSAALDRLCKAGQISGKERLRTVALAYKLGEMAETYQLPAEEEEKWLVYAVEEMLRVLRDEQQASRGAQKAGVRDVAGGQDQSVSLDELELPQWVNQTDVVVPLQALGSFYNKVGQQEYAVPLYLSALSVLMPVDSKRISTENRCRGADVMNSLANTLLIRQPTPDRRTQAEAWVKKAIEVIEHAKKAASIEEAAHCDLVLAAALFNYGSLREMDGDLDSARGLFTDSRRQSSRLNLREGVIQADIAVRRVDRLSRAKENK